MHNFPYRLGAVLANQIILSTRSFGINLDLYVCAYLISSWILRASFWLVEQETPLECADVGGGGIWTEHHKTYTTEARSCLRALRLH